MATRIDELSVTISADMTDLMSVLRKSARDIEVWKRQVEAGRPASLQPATGDLSGYKNQARGLRDVAAAAKESHAGMMSYARGAAAVATGVVAAGVGLSGLAAGFQHVKDSINFAAQAEQTELAFEVMTGSAERAKQLTADIRAFAASTPFNTQQVTAAARSLLAYGAAADTVVPRVKMLGDVSATFGKDLPLDRLTYLYGTAWSSGRLNMVDMKQFALAGVPIWDELGRALKKSRAELEEMVEAGRVGRDEMDAAFVAMTSAGGRFFDMTRRQGETTAGAMEQLSDAVQLAKQRFGEIVIEETGLKDAMKDMEAFTRRVKDNMDVVRPAVRLAGELGRAVAQVGYEFGKAALLAADIRIQQFQAVFPEAEKAAAAFRELVAEAKDFRIDPRTVTETITETGSTFLGFTADIIDGIAQFGPAFEGAVVDPIRAAAETILNMINEVRAFAAAAKVTLAATSPTANLLLNRGVGDPLAADRIAPPVAGMDARRVLKEWEALNNAVLTRQIEMHRPADGLGLFGGNSRDDRKAAYEEAVARRSAYTKGFKDPLSAERELNAGRVPDLAPGAGGRFADALGGAGRDLRNRGDELRAVRGRMIGRFNVESGEAAMLGGAAGGADVIARQRQAADALAVFRDRVADPLLLAGLDSLGAGAVAAAKARSQEAAGMAVAGGAFGVMAQNMRKQLPFQNDYTVPGAVNDIVKDVRQRFGDPLKELKEYYDNLQLARQTPGGITQDQLNAAWVDRVKGVASRLGVGGETRLADAATVGSAEDARLLASFRAGQGSETVESLLRGISGLSERQLEALQLMTRGFNPLRLIDKLW